MFLVSYKARFLVATAVLALGGLVTGAQAATGDAAAGAGKAEEMCSGCHGENGNSEDAINPRLAGQYAGYIAKQVKDFQTAHRANDETMAGMAAMVESNQDALDIGAFYETQKMKGMLTKPNKGLVAEGEKIYRFRELLSQTICKWAPLHNIMVLMKRLFTLLMPVAICLFSQIMLKV